MKNTGHKIFISYRRDDSAAESGRIYDRLVREYGKKAIFKDVNTIPLGSDFQKYLTDTVKDCDIFLAVIGQKWLHLAESNGVRRLDSPTDFVRLEIEAAISENKLVIPVLLHNAQMPKQIDLPESIRTLAYRQGINIGQDPYFHRDMERLLDSLNNHLHYQTSNGNETEISISDSSKKPKNINEATKIVLNGLFENIRGAQSIFLIDLSSSRLLSSYPNGESSVEQEYVGVIGGNSIYTFEKHSEISRPIKIVQMDLLTDDETRISLFRITSDIAICVIGETASSQGVMQIVIEKAKKELITIFQEYGLSFKL